MDKKVKEGFGMVAIGGVLLLAVIAILICDIVLLHKRMQTLETKQESDMSIIHNRVTNIAGDLQNDINNVLDWTEDNSAKLSEMRSIISNTNGALKRVNKQIQPKKEETTEKPVSKAEPIPNSSIEDVEMTEVVVEDKPIIQEAESVDGMTYMGTWCISAYEWTDKACANGNWPTEWYTCAFNEAPLGATIYIPDLGYFVNEDICGTPGRLDIFLGDVDTCKQFGIQYHDVYIVN